MVSLPKMKLTGSQIEELQKALLDAYPTPNALAQMVRVRLDENLNAIASGDDLSQMVFKLITWAETNGRLVDLVNGAHAANPGNPELGAWVRGPWQALLREAPQHPPAPTGDPNTQPAPPPGWVVWWRQLKPELKVLIIVALIAAVGSILAALLPALVSPTPATPTAVAAAPTEALTATPTPTAQPTATPTNTPAAGATASPIPMPTVVRTPLRVGMAAFANCGDEGFSDKLQRKIADFLKGDTLVEYAPLEQVADQQVARSNAKADVVIWGSCDNDTQVTYQAELLVVGDGWNNRIAQPETISLTWPLSSTTLPAQTLAGALAYYGDTTTLQAAALLKQASSTWSKSAKPQQQLNLHWLLGNAWLEHPENMQSTAIAEYELALEQLTESARVALHAQLYYNLGVTQAAMGNLKAAKEQFDRVIQLNPSYGRAYIGRSSMYVQASQYDLAHSDCTEVLSIPGHFALSYVCLARINFYQRRYNELISNAEKAIKADQNYASAYYFAGVGYCDGNSDEEKATSHFLTFLEKGGSLPRWEISPTMIQSAHDYLSYEAQQGCG
jgi:tetratricopeptide (TPR) repeat protein